MQPSEQKLDALLAEVGWLRRFALHLTKDPGAAGDLAQDTLMAALGERGGAGLRQPRAWLAAVAKRLTATGFATLAVDIDVPETAVLERDLELVRTGSLALRVLDGEGQSIPQTLGSPIPTHDLLTVAVPRGKKAFVFGTDASGRTPAAQVDAEGRFLFTNVAPGNFSLRTYSLGAQNGSASVDVEAGGSIRWTSTWTRPRSFRFGPVIHLGRPCARWSPGRFVSRWRTR